MQKDSENRRPTHSLARRIALAATLLLTAATASAQDAIRTELSALKYVMVTAADGTRSEQLLPFTTIVPGESIRYVVTYANTSGTPVSGIVVALPLPREMTLASAIETSPGTDVAYSVDGGASFGALATLSVSEPSGLTRPATLADVTTLRWAIASALAPGASGTVGCRAVLK
jgi:uncharacterized repeat protein (TIGR01451 family)